MAALHRGYIVVTKAANRGSRIPGLRHHDQILVVKWRNLEADPLRRHRPLHCHLPPCPQLRHPCPAAVHSIHSMQQQTRQQILQITSDMRLPARIGRTCDFIIARCAPTRESFSNLRWKFAYFRHGTADVRPNKCAWQ